MPKNARRKDLFLPLALLTLLTLLAAAYAIGGKHVWESSVAVCGDGQVSPGEQCDDWNIHGDDGCSASCTIEKGWACRMSPSACHQVVCGDDLVDPGEQCDDGNRTSADGCSDTCKIESGWACQGEPSVCHPISCGDGFVDLGEQCDDHNVENGDGCSVQCRVEKGWTCTAQPSVCKRTPETVGLLPSSVTKSSAAPSSARVPSLGAQGRPTVAGETINLLKPTPSSVKPVPASGKSSSKHVSSSAK